MVRAQAAIAHPSLHARRLGEIEPVAARAFVRFLLSWQHVSADAPMAGSSALDPVVSQLEGFRGSAGAWESDILAARFHDYGRAGSTNAVSRVVSPLEPVLDPATAGPMAVEDRRHCDADNAAARRRTGIWASTDSGRGCGTSPRRNCLPIASDTVRCSLTN